MPVKVSAKPSGSIYSFDTKEKTVKAPPKKKDDGMLAFIKRLAKVNPSLGRGAKFNEAQQQAVDFLDWKLEPSELLAAKKVFLYLFIGLGALFGVLTYASAPNAITPIGPIESPPALLVAVFLSAIGFMAGNFLAGAATRAAEREKTLSIAYMPQIISYLAMNMRLAPNLERAVEFAANHGKGKIADDFKKLIWDVQIGKYATLEEGLDTLAYKWGNYNDDFKHSLMLIRTAVLEGDKVKYEQLLDIAVEDVLEGSKEKMDVFARQLHQPTVYLYYFGILLPLMLAIVLPMAASMAGGVFGNPLLFVGIYNVFLPVFIYVFGLSILGNRPPTYIAPEIPSDFPGLPKKGVGDFFGVKLPYAPLALIVLIAIIFVGYSIDAARVAAIKADISVLEPEKALEAIPSIVLPVFNATVYFATILSAIIGFGAAAAVYLYGRFNARKKIQDEIRAMETEFKDAIYILASRLGENRPMEDALRHAIEFLPKSGVAKNIFKRILENITMLGMTLDAAIFDKNYGAIKFLPSDVIQSGMRLMVDSVQLGVNVAARSLINLSLQIRNTQKIDDMLKKLLSDVTSMLSTMGTFIAPIVLGVVTSLQQVIVNSLTANCPTAEATAANAASQVGSLSGSGGLASMFCGSGEASKISPAFFTLIMGVYVIEVVILLTYFNSQIEDPKNKLYSAISISKALPVATILFALVAFFAASFLGGIG